jgi:hypothetical protein
MNFWMMVYSFYCVSDLLLLVNLSVRGAMGRALGWLGLMCGGGPTPSL